jgi:hypothetical protein
MAAQVPSNRWFKDWRTLGNLEKPYGRHCEPAGAGEAIQFDKGLREVDRFAAVAMMGLSSSPFLDSDFPKHSGLRATGCRTSLCVRQLHT